MILLEDGNSIFSNSLTLRANRYSTWRDICMGKWFEWAWIHSLDEWRTKQYVRNGRLCYDWHLMGLAMERHLLQRIFHCRYGQSILEHRCTTNMPEIYIGWICLFGVDHHNQSMADEQCNGHYFWLISNIQQQFENHTSCIKMIEIKKFVLFHYKLYETNDDV